MKRVYVCIDLKSFYASVECVERGLDPITTNLVVADISRTEKTICLAVSPSLKSYGLPGRARLFEVNEKIKNINIERQRRAYKHKFSGKSYNIEQLNKNNNLKLDYIVAPPRMAYYLDYSTKIYNVYLKYLAPEDIYVYSIDEVFCDITNYLKYYNMGPNKLVTNIIKDIYNTTGITATAGIGDNLYLAKVAMDIVSKHTKPNKLGVRVAYLDEMSYRKLLWSHKPITDFWRVGTGYAKRLEKYNIYTMGDIARTSIDNEDLLYKLFGVNAEILIDHAWGYEPCTISDIKNYKPINNSLTQGQVLSCPYDFKKARLVVSEMMDLLSLELVSKNLITDRVTLTIGYDICNDIDDIETDIDRYGRVIPKSSHGTISLEYKTSSTNNLTLAILKLYDSIVKPSLKIKRINMCVSNLDSSINSNQKIIKQLDLFTDSVTEDNKIKNKILSDENERKIQNTVLNIKQKYGKNSIIKGMDLQDGATTIERNGLIGGHKA